MLMKRRRRRPGVWGAVRRSWGHVWRTLVAGLLVWVPLLTTVSLLWLFVSRFLFPVEDLLQKGFRILIGWASGFPWFSFLGGLRYPYGFGMFLVFALFFGTGILTRHLIGQRIIALGEQIVRVIPFVNRIYSAVQQIRDVFVGRQGTVFQNVCLIEYPRPGMVAVAFVTAREQGVVQETVGKELLAVFVPTTPNPTSGYLVYLPPEEVQVLDISVEEAMKLIVSGGAYLPGKAKQRAGQIQEDEPAAG